MQGNQEVGDCPTVSRICSELQLSLPTTIELEIYTAHDFVSYNFLLRFEHGN